MSIMLHIERLVLDEALLGNERVGAVRAAIVQELSQRLAQPGGIDALRRIGATNALSPVALPPAAHPHDGIGLRIATAVQHGLGVPSAIRSKSGMSHV